MGYFKQLHIDCWEGNCAAGWHDTCYMQPDNVSYYDFDSTVDQEAERVYKDQDFDSTVDEAFGE